MKEEMKKWQMWSVATNHNNIFPSCPYCTPYPHEQEQGLFHHQLLPDYQWENGKIIAIRWECENGHYTTPWEKS